MQHDPINDNERLVLDAIWRLGPLSRSDVATLTGLTAMTVSRATKSLEQRDLTVESTPKSGKRGNQTRLLSINVEAGYSFGVDITASMTQMACIDLSGQVLFHQDLQIGSDQSDALLTGIEQALETACQKILKARPEQSDPLSRFLGIGFSIPGDFTLRGRRMAANAQFIHMGQRDLQDEFSAQLPLRVHLNSDSNNSAIGERLLGAGRNYQTFIQLNLGYGVGGGIILKGEPYFGVHKNAGILGSMFPHSQPRPSGIDYVRSLSASGHDKVKDFHDLTDLDVMAMPETLAWIKRAGQQLREKLIYPVRFLDPEAIIVGGRLPVTMLQALTAEIDRPDFCTNDLLGAQMPRVRVLPSMLGPRAATLGAAALPIYASLFDQTS